MSKINSYNVYDIFWLIITFLFNLRITVLRICDIKTNIFTIIIILLSLSLINIKRFRIEGLAIIFFILFFLGTTHGLSLILILLLTYLSRYIDITRLAGFNFFLSSIFFILNYYIMQLGYAHIEYYDLTYKGGQILSDFGYGNTNTFSFYLFYISISLYLYCKRKNTLLYFIIIAIAYFSYYLTGSRTVLLSNIIFIFLSLIQKTKIKNILFCKTALYILPIGIIVIILFFTYHSFEYPIIDNLFSLRFSYSLKALESMSLLNYIIGFDIPDDIIIDIAYYSLLCTAGILGLIVFLTLYFKAIKKININSPLLPVIVSYMISGMSENNMMNSIFLGGMFLWFILYKTAFPPYRLY